MYRKFLSFFVLMFVFSFSCESVFCAELSDVGGLTIEECLILALTNHPSLRSAKSSTRDYIAQLEAIRASNRVSVSLSGSLSYRGAYERFDDRYGSESLSLEASKTLYDTGRTRLKQEMAQESIKGSLETERSRQIDVAAEAKKAYYDLVLQFLKRDVEREKLRNSEDQLRKAQGQYEVGTSSYVDVTKAQADVASARVSLIKAENNILVYQEALRVAMGTDINGPFNIALSTELLLPSLPDKDVNTLIATAFEEKPDYRKLQHDYRSAELSIKNAARSNSPKITGTVGTSLSNSETSKASEAYTLGVNMSMTVIDGGAMKAEIESKRAALERTEAEIDSAKQSLIYDVRRSVLNLTNAIDTVKASELTVKYAEENLELERGRYEVGVGDSLSVSNAISALASARESYYQALHDAQSARAELDKSIGHFPHEVAERVSQ